MLFFTLGTHSDTWASPPATSWYVGVPARDKHYFTTSLVVEEPASVVTVT